MNTFATFWEDLFDNHIGWLSNPLTPSVLMFFTYFIVSFPFLVVDYRRMNKENKIQPGKYATKSHILDAIYDYIFCEMVVYVPLTALAVLTDTKSNPAVRRELPSLYEFFIDIWKIYALMDLLFYVVHYALHTKILYKHVHSVHHRHRSPFVLSTQSHHWVESILMAMVTTVPIYTFGRHVITQWAALMITMTHGILIHSGYDSGIEKWTFGLICAEPTHDLHHKRVVYNFGAYTSIYDRLFGTHLSPMQRNEKQTLENNEYLAFAKSDARNTPIKKLQARRKSL